MIGASLSMVIFLILATKISLFKKGKWIENSWMPEHSKFTIASMPFSIERIVYYITLPNPIFLNDSSLDSHLLVEPIYKEAFDSVPIAIQVFYVNEGQRKLVAEILRHRFDIPYLDSLLGEGYISEKMHEHIRNYKFGHASTQEMLKKEVMMKINGKEKTGR